MHFFLTTIQVKIRRPQNDKFSVAISLDQLKDEDISPLVDVLMDSEGYEISAVDILHESHCVLSDDYLIAFMRSIDLKLRFVDLHELSSRKEPLRFVLENLRCIVSVSFISISSSKQFISLILFFFIFVLESVNEVHVFVVLRKLFDVLFNFSTDLVCLSVLYQGGLACQVLNLRSNQIKKLNMAGRFISLHTLNLDFCTSLTNLQQDCFSCMPNLLRLSICETRITNLWTTSAALAKLPSLKELRFQNCLCCKDTGLCPSYRERTNFEIDLQEISMALPDLDGEEKLKNEVRKLLSVRFDII